MFGAISLVGCAGEQGAVCTEMGAPAGIGVEIDQAVAEQITDEVTVTVFWDDAQIETAVALYPVTEAVDQGCSDDDLDGSCSAVMVPTGGKTGFVDIFELPQQPVDVVVRLTGRDGTLHLEETLQLVPEPTYPNGRDCPPGGNQAQIVVALTGDVMPGRNE